MGARHSCRASLISGLTVVVIEDAGFLFLTERPGSLILI